MDRFLDVFATPREAGGLKVPKRRENEEHGNDGGDQAVATYFADKAELQVDKVHRRDHRGLDFGAAPPSRRTVRPLTRRPSCARVCALWQGQALCRREAISPNA